MTKTSICPMCGGSGHGSGKGTAVCHMCGASFRFGDSGRLDSFEVSGTSSDEVARVAKDLAAHLGARSANARTTGPQEEAMIDPLSAMTAIGSGLALVDKFVDLVRKVRSSDQRPHRVEAKQEAGALVIRRDGQVVERVSAQQLHLNEWDAARFDALRQRVSSLWSQFNGLYGQLPNLSVDEQVRIGQRMESMRQALCKDFREMVDISEKVLGVALDDHYTLYSTCHDGLS